LINTIFSSLNLKFLATDLYDCWGIDHWRYSAAFYHRFALSEDRLIFSRIDQSFGVYCSQSVCGSPLYILRSCLVCCLRWRVHCRCQRIQGWPAYAEKTKSYSIQSGAVDWWWTFGECVFQTFTCANHECFWSSPPRSYSDFHTSP